ncbi:kinase-like protein [Annulohypoxylon maeteangense]|uniref:kinase-like protein n=1 Tax=Annulohypoxylon maeteangense TaxID=1927788 RepID=UPI0020088C4C|nr:kinase-like protein [Annulohypoxylon maeteangense]KAI0880287.1 kinase-like protein [Annulohypoxylon maeteangense]
MDPATSIRALEQPNDNTGPSPYVYGIGDLRNIWTRFDFELLVGKGHVFTETEKDFISKHLIRTFSLLTAFDYTIHHDVEVETLVTRWVNDKTKFDDELLSDNLVLIGLSRIRDDPAKFNILRQKLTAPILQEGIETKLGANQRMPFIEEDNRPDTSAYHIANGHLVLGGDNPQPNNRVKVTRKRLRVGHPAFTEIEILRSLRGALRNSQSVQISTYVCMVKSSDETQIQSISLHANGGTLEDCISRINSIQPAPIKACLEQMACIAGAIEFLHQIQALNNPSDQESCYCHLDIKPHNIIVFQDEGRLVGVWKVIDFGISKVRRPTLQGTHIPVPGTHTVQTTTRQLGGTYQPPEVNQQNVKAMGRRSDIWSLGCILVELITAFSGGLVMLREQLKQSAIGDRGIPTGHAYYFYQTASLQSTWTHTPGPCFELNEHILQCLIAPPDTEVVSNCKDLIRKMLLIDRTKRMKSASLVEELGRIVDICPEDDELAQPFFPAQEA